MVKIQKVKKKPNTNIVFNLMQNAEDSLHHAIEHLLKNDVNAGDYKRVILDLTHVLELFLKERLYRLHPAFILDNIDKKTNGTPKTVSIDKAFERIINYDEIDIKSYKGRVVDCKNLRNQITHYEFNKPVRDIKLIIGRILSFIFWFSRNHLNKDYQKQFDYNNMEKLIALQEFWEDHVKEIKNELHEFKKCFDISSCLRCGNETFVIKNANGKCRACNFVEKVIECSVCKKYFPKSDFVSDWSPIMCETCFADEMDEMFDFSNYE